MRKAKQVTGILMASIMASTVLAGRINESAPSSIFQVETRRDSGAGNGAPAASGSQITPRFTWWGGDERDEATPAVIGQYQKLHPEVRIEAEINPDQGYIDKVSAMLTSDTALDILQQNVDSSPDFVSRGDLFVDLYEYKDTFDTSGFDETFASQFSTFDRKFLTLPTGMSCLATVVNKNAAKTRSVDLTEQTTRDSMLEDGRKFHAENSDYYYMDTDTKILCEYVSRPYLRQIIGESFIINNERKMSFTRDQLVGVLMYIKGYYDGDVFESAEDSATFKGQIHTDPKWTDGKFIFAYGPSSSINLLTDVVPEAERIVVQILMAKDRISDGFFADMPQYMAANKNSECVEEAVGFPNYSCNSTETRETLKDVRSIPSISTARQLCADKGLLNQAVVDAADLAAGLNGRSDKGYTASAEVHAIREDVIESIVYGQSTPEETVGNAIEPISDYLSDLHQKAPESNVKEVGK